jgi:hypothetical protein
LKIAFLILVLQLVWQTPTGNAVTFDSCPSAIIGCVELPTASQQLDDSAVRSIDIPSEHSGTFKAAKLGRAPKDVHPFSKVKHTDLSSAYIDLPRPTIESFLNSSHNLAIMFRRYSHRTSGQSPP